MIAGYSLRDGRVALDLLLRLGTRSGSIGPVQFDVEVKTFELHGQHTSRFFLHQPFN